MRRFLYTVFTLIIMSIVNQAGAATAHAGAAASNPNSAAIVLGMGCFWGAEQRMAAIPGVLDVESGYANGEVAGEYQTVLQHERLLRMGMAQKRNHAEVVKVTFDPARVSLQQVLAGFWENHDPTQGDRQGNDVGSNYRSAIYTDSAEQADIAQQSRAIYQQALTQAGLGAITTEIAPLTAYFKAEEYHQDYLLKNPSGYCGLGGTGVAFPLAQLDASAAAKPASPLAAGANSASQYPRLDGAQLASRQLVVFAAEHCAYCARFNSEIMASWQAEVPITSTLNPNAPTGWQLQKALFATPTIVLFQDGQELARYTGYDGDHERFWQWLGYQLLSPAQQRIAFEQGTERAFSGSHLDEARSGTFVDPISGAPLFRSDSKYDSGSGWPSFFNPVPGALSLHEDNSHGMRRVEVRSASSGIHLGHVFDDGPPPSGKRYCINGEVLRFVPDEPS